MVKKLTFALALTLYCGVALCQTSQGKLISPPTDCEVGYEKGVSGQFSGILTSGAIVITGRAIVVAGGANFPGVAAVDGGKKVFYKGIYMLQDDKWRQAGDMEQAAAYGGSVRLDDKLIFVGGANENGALKSATVYHYDASANKFTIAERLPNLPEPIEQCGVVAIDSAIYVVGGLASGVPSDRIYRLDLNNKEWELLDVKIPSKVIQPLVVSIEDSIYIWGGFSLPATVYSDGWMLNTKTKSWSTLPAAPTGNLTGATAIMLFEQTMVVFGGVNSDIFRDALERRHKLSTATGDERMRLLKDDKKYMLMSAEKYRFNDKMLIYNHQGRFWTTKKGTPHFARAGGVALYLWDNLVFIGGEIKPGVRTPYSYKLYEKF